MKGDILMGSKRDRDAAFHSIVHLEGNLDDDFIGTVLTHSGEYTDNVLMDRKHFKKCDIEGKEYSFFFDNTYLVSRRFSKLKDWGPFKKIGELTKEGVNFVESKMVGKDPILWSEYELFGR